MKTDSKASPVPERKNEVRKTKINRKTKNKDKSDKEIENEVFESLSKGKVWKFVRILIIPPIVFGLLALIDHALPTSDNYQHITDMKSQPAIYKYYVYDNDGAEIEIEKEAYENIEIDDAIVLDYSPILNEYYGCRIKKASDEKLFIKGEEDTVYYLYPIFPLFFMLPSLLFFHKRKSVVFYVLYFASVFLYPLMLAHYLFIEEKTTPISHFFVNLF